MEIQDLPMGRSREPVELPHFPTRWQAVLWRNWRQVPAERIAAVLGCGVETLRREAAALGLDGAAAPDEGWLRLGYQTVIRQNWHLLNYAQLLQLLGWSADRLAMVLKEEDFFWVKLGQLKPACAEVRWAPLTPAQREATERFRGRWRRHVGEGDLRRAEVPFQFSRQYHAMSLPGGRPRFEMSFIHAYEAGCGDVFLDIEGHDPMPDALLEQYASMGITAVWVHAVLYLLHPIPGAEEYSEGWERRLRNLGVLARRCRRHGLGIYLYFNEPRFMPASFYQIHPEWQGAEVPGRGYCNCTSRPGPLQWMEEAYRAVYTAVPELAGALLITMSENPTHCLSKQRQDQCPYCRDRDPAEIIAEVVSAAERGIHAANPQAAVIAEDWAWERKRSAAEEAEIRRQTEGKEWLAAHLAVLQDKAAFKKRVIDRLPASVWYLSISEWGKPICVGGVPGVVRDYSISQVGPSPEAVEVWRHAQSRGLKTIAKIQMNNSWELSAVPYVPVPGLVDEHLRNLEACGVKGLMLSWTLGGYPGGNLPLLRRSTDELSEALFTAEVAAGVREAWRQFGEAYREFPFSVQTMYCGPMNYGPQALFRLKPTGYHGSMIGYPYDDLGGWRCDYPEEVFEEQFRKVTDGWRGGLETLARLEGRLKASDQAPFAELRNMAEAAYCHLYSSYLQVRFVRLRNAGRWSEIPAVVRAELSNTLALLRLSGRDSRIGFEASNHYYYTQSSLIEKIVNCQTILDTLKD